MTNRKIPTKQEMISELRRGKISLPPVSFRFMEDQPIINEKTHLDALIEASWHDRIVKFGVECKSISTPKVFQEALSLLKSVLLPNGYKPMLFVPFLSELQLQELERAGVSGIDLVGNGVVVHSAFVVFRTGARNRFSSSARIKNIYRRNSSMVARVFLAHPVYDTVQEIGTEINQRNMLVQRWDKKTMSLSTVSKALSTLEQDLIVERKDKIRLLQPDKLLEKLSANYEPPKIKNRVCIRIVETLDTINKLILKQSQELELPVVSTGTSAVTQFAVMQRGEMLSVYCPRLEALLDRLHGNQSDRFPNLELIETEDETAYFDSKRVGDFWSASPVQSYLELMAGDKRDRETAEQVKSYILMNLQKASQ